MAIKRGNQHAGALFLNVAFVLSLVLIITMAEGRTIFGLNMIKAKASTPVCDQVVGVKAEDTCFDLAKEFNLTTNFFNAINPNLNCTALFIGQWLCVDGTLV